LTDPDGGQRLRIPSNSSKNSPVEATSSIAPPAGAVTTASPVRPLIAGERTPWNDGKPLRSLHPQPPPNAPSPQAREPINVPSATLERPAQPLAQAIPKEWVGLKPAGASWVTVYDRLSSAVKVRHYSPKTLEAYKGWTQKFQTFTKSKESQLVSMDDVKGFLSFLAVDKKVAAATQNQAFNALLFLFKHVLEKEFGKVEGVVRAKRTTYIPVVLSRAEVDRVLRFLKDPYDLVAKLLYGCGLRLFECLKLRVQDLNFEMKVLTVHDGKGRKDRTVPLPQVLAPELNKQLETVRRVHREDLAAGYAGTFLPGALGEKYKRAEKELVWQWLFPAKTLTQVPTTREYRRYHLHETHVQAAIKRAVQRSQIPKRASAHTFRHYAEFRIMPSEV
jgi:integron integrase